MQNIKQVPLSIQVTEDPILNSEISLFSDNFDKEAFKKAYLIPLVNCFGSLFGTSILTLSSGIAKAGPAIWLICMFFSIFLNYSSSVVILSISKKEKFSNFIDFSFVFNNKIMKTIFKVVYLLLNFCILISCACIFNSLAVEVCSNLQFKNRYLAEENAFGWILILHLLTIPLALKSKLKDFAILTVITFFSALVLALFFINSVFTLNVSRETITSVFTIVNWKELPSTFSICFFVFSLQLNVFSIYKEHPSKKISSIKPILIIIFSILFVLYSLVGFSGFIYSSNRLEELKQKEIILKMFGNNSKMIIFVNIMMILVSVNSFLFSFKPNKDIIFALLNNNDEIRTEENTDLSIMENEEKKKNLNSIITFGLLFFSVFISVLLAVLQISFVKIIDFASEVLMQVLFVFLPFIIVLKNKLSPGIFILFVISLGLYVSHFVLKFK